MKVDSSRRCRSASGSAQLLAAWTAIELGALFHRARNVIPAVQRVIDRRFTTVDTQRHLLLGHLVREPDLEVPIVRIPFHLLDSAEDVLRTYRPIEQDGKCKTDSRNKRRRRVRATKRVLTVANDLHSQPFRGWSSPVKVRCAHGLSLPGVVSHKKHISFFSFRVKSLSVFDFYLINNIFSLKEISFFSILKPDAKFLGSRQVVRHPA